MGANGKYQCFTPLRMHLAYNGDSCIKYIPPPHPPPPSRPPNKPPKSPPPPPQQQQQPQHLLPPPPRSPQKIDCDGGMLIKSIKTRIVMAIFI
ncbi:hypothetical protein OSTOST_12123 [Ostertagia ostertagi]